MSPADAVFFNAQGALVFGAFVSTLLTLVVIPILYHVAESRTLARACATPI
jgi:multidrug efflux pump subunit AcrB